MLVSVTSAGAVAGRKKVVPRCPGAHSRMVVADGQAEVYLAPEEAALPEFLGFYGCSFAHRRSYLLGSPPAYSSSGGSGIKLETLAGPIVAYASSSSGQVAVHWLIIVRDLRNGRILHSVPTGTRLHPEPPRTEGGITGQDVGSGPAKAIVDKSDGAVAWIVETDREEGSYQVHALDGSGSRLLAEGAEIEPSSLALAGSTLYWTQGGKAMSASLH